MKYLISPDKKQYKANLHCHSTLSDGKCSPEQLKEMYKREGYSILAITDHERPTEHQDLCDRDFVMITGYECYIRPTGKSDRFQKEIHMNLLARDPKNVKWLYPDERYCRYLQRDGVDMDSFEAVGEKNARVYSHDFINEYIRTARENGYLVTYNHPYWSMEDEADIFAYEGYFSLEIANYSSYILNGLEYSGALYDKLLTAGRRVFCHGADDNHNAKPDYPDSFGAFAVIMPEALSYSGVIEAMEKGEMYASMGPIFREVSIEDGKIHIECSEVESIYLYEGHKKTKFVHAGGKADLTSADFPIDESARYVRVSIRDGKGRWADTRGYFPDEL